MNEIQTIHIIIMIGVLLALIIGGIAIIIINRKKNECNHEDSKILKWERGSYIVAECLACGEKFLTDLEKK